MEYLNYIRLIKIKKYDLLYILISRGLFMKKTFKKAFTMAEVLVTLIIIGVIASMTIPSLQADANKRTYVAGCKKAFSTLSNALALAEQTNGPIRKWGLSESKSYSDFEEFFLPHLNTVTLCNDTKGCFAEEYKSYTNEQSDSITDKGYGTPGVAAILADGMSVSYDLSNSQNSNTTTDILGVNTSSPIVVFAVDTNGTKNPNTIGEDVFFFVVTRDGLKPAGSDKSLSDINCGKDKDGTECAALVIKYGDLDYDKHIEEAKSTGDAGSGSGDKQEPTDKRKGS